jgi:hypothetical protein
MVAKHYLRDLRSDAQALLQQRGHWLAAAVTI